MARPPKKERADLRMVKLGLATSAQEALALILAGKVFAEKGPANRRVKTAGEAIDSATLLRLEHKEHPWVSRGGVKLAAALDAWAIDPKGRVAADIGISTGGFSDVLLSRGALRIHAVDVGYGQTAWKIRTDPRVHLLERTNARLLAPDAFGEPIGLMVIDLSFIRLGQVLPSLLRFLAPGAELVVLVKPQFEVEPSQVAAGGIVIDPEARRRAVEEVVELARSLGLHSFGQIESPIKGADGNLEHLVAFRYQPGESER